jgi:hypothetical protein
MIMFIIPPTQKGGDLALMFTAHAGRPWYWRGSGINKDFCIQKHSLSKQIDLKQKKGKETR